jgi:hypothetical protein
MRVVERLKNEGKSREAEGEAEAFAPPPSRPQPL